MVTLEKVGKRYGAKDVLRDVSLRLEAGGFYFLTGSSGAGKTTLLNILWMADLPSQGKVVLFDTDVTAADRATRTALRRRLGIVFPDFRLLPHLSVGDNVALPLRLAGMPEREIRDPVDQLLEWVGMADQVDALPPTLSGAEQQRVAIARAVVHRPDFLIADEPTANVDRAAAAVLVRAFERMNELGTTVLIASHAVAFCGQFGHRQLHLDNGRVAEMTEPALPAAGDVC